MANSMHKTACATVILLCICASLLAQGTYQERKAKQLAGPSPFQNEIDGKTKRILYQDSLVTVLDGIPGANQLPIHLLGVPNKRIPTLNETTDNDAYLIGHLIWALKNEAKKKGIDSTGYRIVFNTNEDAGQSAIHIHAHLLGGLRTGAMVEQDWRNVQRAKRAITDSNYLTPTTADLFLVKLMGQWNAKGKVLNVPAEISLRAEPDLQFQYLKFIYHVDMHPNDSTIKVFERTSVYRPAEKDHYKGTWYDTDGGIAIVTPSIQNNSLTAEWGIGTTSSGKTIYRFVDDNTLEITELIKQNGTWKEVDKNILQRKW